MKIRSNDKIYIELLRIIAVAFVLYNHTAGYSLYYVSDGLKQTIYMIIAMITRINVPLFMMISGTLLLGKRECIISVLKKRFVRMIVVLLTFSLIVYFEYMYRYGSNGPISLNTFLRRFISGNIDGAGSYWYLYMYLGWIIFLPFMQKMLDNLSKTDFIVLVVCHALVFSILPAINIFLKLNGFGSIGLSGSFVIPFVTEKYFFYSIIGYYIDQKIQVRDIKKSQWWTLVIMCIAGIAVECFCTYSDFKINGRWSQDYVQMFDYILAIAAFLIVKRLLASRKKANRAIDRIILTCGGATFGIYLLDPILYPIFFGKYNRLINVICSKTIIIAWGWVALSMILGGIITILLKRIKFVCRFL